MPAWRRWPGSGPWPIRRRSCYPTSAVGSGPAQASLKPPTTSRDAGSPRDQAAARPPDVRPASIRGDIDHRSGRLDATALFWRPQIALFVNEVTLLAVLVPLAPAATVLDRFSEALAEVLLAHGASPAFLEAEVGEMGGWRLAQTPD